MAENSPGAVFLLVTFVGAMVWIVWMGWRRSRFGGVSEVSASDQAVLAQRARAFFVDPAHKLTKVDTPSEFDVQVLSLLDSIEANRDNIDAKLENLRTQLKTTDTWQRFKDKSKLDLVFRDSAAFLVRGRMTTGLRQLSANWRMVGRLGSSGSEVSSRPGRWIRPLINDSSVGVSPGSGLASRKVMKLSATGQTLWAAAFFSVTGAMIAYGLSHDATIMLEWGVGIFFAVVVLYTAPRIVKRSR